MSSSNSAPSSESFVLSGDATEQGFDIPLNATFSQCGVYFVGIRRDATKRLKRDAAKSARKKVQQATGKSRTEDLSDDDLAEAHEVCC